MSSIKPSEMIVHFYFQLLKNLKLWTVFTMLFICQMVIADESPGEATKPIRPMRVESIFKLEDDAPPGKPSRPKYISDYHGNLGFLGLKSNAKSETEYNIQGRDFYVYGINLEFGYRYISFIYGIGGSYSKWNQDTDPAAIGNSNLQGRQTQAGILIGYDFDFGEMIGRYNFFNSYTTDNRNILGDEIKYLNGFSYDLQFRLNISRSWFIGLDYNYSHYNNYSANTVRNSLSSDDKTRFVALGIITGVKY